jgi:hypothetical protein
VTWGDRRDIRNGEGNTQSVLLPPTFKNLKKSIYYNCKSMRDSTIRLGESFLSE